MRRSPFHCKTQRGQSRSARSHRTAAPGPSQNARRRGVADTSGSEREGKEVQGARRWMPRWWHRRRVTYGGRAECCRRPVVGRCARSRGSRSGRAPPTEIYSQRHIDRSLSRSNPRPPATPSPVPTSSRVSLRWVASRDRQPENPFNELLCRLAQRNR